MNLRFYVFDSNAFSRSKERFVVNRFNAETDADTVFFFQVPDNVFIDIVDSAHAPKAEIDSSFFHPIHKVEKHGSVLEKIFVGEGNSINSPAGFDHFYFI